MRGQWSPTKAFLQAWRLPGSALTPQSPPLAPRHRLQADGEDATEGADLDIIDGGAEEATASAAAQALAAASGNGVASLLGGGGGGLQAIADCDGCFRAGGELPWGYVGWNLMQPGWQACRARPADSRGRGVRAAISLNSFTPPSLCIPPTGRD